MPVLRLTLEYDGTRYVGWQVQPNGPSIQGELEGALAILSGAPRRVTGAGRTDAGVHALGQVASLPEPAPLPLAAYAKGLNALLPPDIAVREAALEGEGFDARRSARGKRYVYRILRSSSRRPLSRLQTWQLSRALDLGAMRVAAAPLVGRHDFACFQAAGCAAAHAVRDLTRLDLLESGEELRVEVEATAFVRHMVRNIVGTLVEVGLGRRQAGSMPELLASRDRALAGKTAPPQGLCLDEVFY